MTELFSGPLAQAVGWALLHLLWQGVLVAAILAASLALLRRQSANARYLASCGALVVIVALSFATAYRAYEPIRISTQTAVPGAEESGGGAVSMSLGQPEALVLHWTAQDVASHMPQIVFIWLLGVTLLSTRLIIGWITAHRLAARYAHDAEPQWQRAMERIATALNVRRAIQLLESATVEVPTVVGWLRPVILLPIATVSGLAAEQIEMILAHELAHIRRHDFIVNLMQSAVETLFFYQPAVWWISRRIRIEREHCCDDLAVAVSGDPVRYARALTRFEELRIDAAQTVLAASGGSLVARIRRLVGVDGEAASWSSRCAAGAALLVVVVALLVAPTLPVFANHETPQAAPPPPAPHASKACSEIDVQAAQLAPDAVDPDDNAADAAAAEPPDPPDVAPAAMPVVNVASIVDQAVAAAPIPDVASIVDHALAYAPVAIAQALPAIAEGRAARAPRAFRHARDHAIDERHLTVDDLITLRSVGVTPKYIDEMRSAGLGRVSLDDIVALRAQGVTADYLRSLRDAGVPVTSARAAVELRAQGVSGEYINAMRDAGFRSSSTEELVQMRAVGVSPKYIEEMASAGYRNLSARELVQLRAQGVTADFVRTLAEAGYANLSVRDLSRLAATGVNAEFIRDLAKYRTKP